MRKATGEAIRILIMEQAILAAVGREPADGRARMAADLDGLDDGGPWAGR